MLPHLVAAKGPGRTAEGTGGAPAACRSALGPRERTPAGRHGDHLGASRRSGRSSCWPVASWAARCPRPSRRSWPRPSSTRPAAASTWTAPSRIGTTQKPMRARWSRIGRQEGPVQGQAGDLLPALAGRLRELIRGDRAEGAEGESRCHRDGAEGAQVDRGLLGQVYGGLRDADGPLQEDLPAAATEVHQAVGRGQAREGRGGGARGGGSAGVGLPARGPARLRGPDGEKTAQLQELAGIVLGIRLFNQHQGKGGANLPALGDTVSKLGSEDLLQRVQQEVEDVTELCRAHADVAMASGGPASGKAAKPLAEKQLDQLVSNLLYHRQYLCYLLNLQEDLAASIERLQADQGALQEELLDLDALVGGRVSVPKEQVYPRFDALARSYTTAFQEVKALEARSRLHEVLSEMREQYFPPLAAPAQKALEDLRAARQEGGQAQAREEDGEESPWTSTPSPGRGSRARIDDCGSPDGGQLRRLHVAAARLPGLLRALADCLRRAAGARQPGSRRREVRGALQRVLHRERTRGVLRRPRPLLRRRSRGVLQVPRADPSAPRA
ncbi:unnamed protein product [Prorocentrum cordatum]|uniref:Cilia- and flagella-associated protein 206 n=1 Tax=Prorocentrum cordatum TaxID=2364126 RepID=A0ABN9XAG5_9DINO|nr:unnamed protein product [Polarella glacialis]